MRINATYHHHYEGLIRIVLICWLFFLASISNTEAQIPNTKPNPKPNPQSLGQSLGQSLIYGTVSTKTGNSYTGFLRWGTEEGTWSCLMQGRKSDHHGNGPVKKASSTSSNSISDFDWSLKSIWEDKVSSYGGSQFACEFGAIKKMTVYNQSDVTLTFRNGAKLDLRGGSYDIGEDIIVEDIELGQIDLKWEVIREINFKSAPSNIEIPYLPIYGRAYSIEGYSYEGHIRWDNDERVSTDILNGSTPNIQSKLKLKMKEVVKISNLGNASMVTLKSGRTIKMYDSNDIDEGNRGVHIRVTGIGEVNIPWDEFDRIEFFTPKNLLKYSDFRNIKKINGTIKTNDNKSHQGQIMFDLDESWNFELLDGKSRGLEFKVPFYNIQSIERRNNRYCKVKLNNGKTLILGDNQDLDYRNAGLLVRYSNSNKTDYIKWEDIYEISFKR